MSSRVYDDAYVVISQLLKRRYNNPLGEAAFPLLERLLTPGARPVRVLDVGCGRGHTTLYWARKGANVVGFDPAVAMLAEAQRLIDESGLSERVRLECSTLGAFDSTERFDLILVHDVLCYSDHRQRDLEKLLTYLAPNALLSVSDYFAESDADVVTTLLHAWGISMPNSFSSQTDQLRSSGATVLWLCETTRQYRHHWSEVRERLTRQRGLFVERAGEPGVAAFEAKITAIERAVDSRQFGHYWALLAPPGDTHGHE